jgi:hypothetical protein
MIHPVSLFNGLTVGFLIVIGMVHNHAHYSMDLDPESYVRKWCKKNQDVCRRYTTPDDY